MRSNLKPAAIVVAVVALLAFAPAAMAKHGGDGGGGGDNCATIDSFNMSTGYIDSQPSLTWNAQTTNNCIDEFGGSTAIDSWNSNSTFKARSVYFGRGTMTFGGTGVATPGVTYWITVSVYTPSGKLVDSRTKSVTAGPAL
jgi:hypothetical protein